MPKNARCSRCKRHGHWQQDCFVGRIRLDECFDAQGLKDARRDLAALQPMGRKQELRKKWIGDYLEKVDKGYGPADERGLRWQRKVAYVQRCDSKGEPTGRHTAKSVGGGPAYADGSVSQIHLQGMLRELRGYAVGPSARSCPAHRQRERGHAHDLDFKCCQPTLLSQLPAKLTWADERAPPSVKQLLALCTGTGRDELYKELAEYHALDPDSAHYDGYQKDLLKKLTTSLCFMGTYEGWIRREELPSMEPHPRIKALQAELEQLRIAVFESVEWAPFVAEWREVLKKEKAGDAKAIDRSVMARIAQDLEAKALLAMKAQLEEDGWVLLALVFDGAIVRHREGHAFDLGRLQERVRRDTRFEMVINEKPLFDAEPKLTLDREFGGVVEASPTSTSGTWQPRPSNNAAGSSSRSHVPQSNASGSSSSLPPRVGTKAALGSLRRSSFVATKAQCKAEERASARAARREEAECKDAEQLGSDDSANSDDSDDSDDSFIVKDSKKRTRDGHESDDPEWASDIGEETEPPSAPSRRSRRLEGAKAPDVYVDDEAEDAGECIVTVGGDASALEEDERGAHTTADDDPAEGVDHIGDDDKDGDGGQGHGALSDVGGPSGDEVPHEADPAEGAFDCERCDATVAYCTRCDTPFCAQCSLLGCTA